MSVKYIYVQAFPFETMFESKDLNSNDIVTKQAGVTITV
jgi:hypothetical protein